MPSPLDMMADLPQEADDNDGTVKSPETPSKAFIASLVGLVAEEAYWMCLRAGANFRTETEDGEKLTYPLSYFPAWTGGILIDVEKDIVTTARYDKPALVPDTKKKR